MEAEVPTEAWCMGEKRNFRFALRHHWVFDISEELSSVFPWLNFFLGTQRDYLAKEESTAGAHGVETRYPFLDRNLVQEFLWLSADTKNALYKASLHQWSFAFIAPKASLAFQIWPIVT